MEWIPGTWRLGSVKVHWYVFVTLFLSDKHQASYCVALASLHHAIYFDTVVAFCCALCCKGIRVFDVESNGLIAIF